MKLYPVLFFTGMLLYAASAVPRDTTTTLPERANSISADSLQHLADSLEEKARQLEQQLDEVDTMSINDSGNGFSDEISRLKNELTRIREHIKASVHSSFHKEVDVPVEPKEEEDEIEDTEDIRVLIEKSRRKKWFGSLAFSFEYTGFDVSPLEQLAENDRSLADVPISFSHRRRMLTLGVLGYYSRDNSVRVGNGLMIGYQTFHSEPFSRSSNKSDTTDHIDSMITLRVIPLHFGFLCEKMFRYENVDFFAGIMIGGHLTIVVKEDKTAELSTSFISNNTRDNENSDYSVALSPAIYWDMHSGIAFPLSDRIHFGVEGVLRFAYAYEGFGAGFGDYLTVSPGIRLRLSFGTAG